MGNIVSLRTRLEALEQKRAVATVERTKVERDAAVKAHIDRLMVLSDAELDAVEASEIAAVEPGPYYLNQRAAIAAGFTAIRRRRDAGNPTPPFAA